ncbi:MAG TPA: hypothetical protein VFJ24_01580 [Gaiellales bacterium]|nr:hypothetical protein [Gaiellales bacterium]
MSDQLGRIETPQERAARKQHRGLERQCEKVATREVHHVAATNGQIVLDLYTRTACGQGFLVEVRGGLWMVGTQGTTSVDQVTCLDCLRALARRGTP